MKRVISLFPAFICVLIVATSTVAQDASPEANFQNDLVKSRLMELPGFEAVAVNFDGPEPYVIVYLSRAALPAAPQTFTAQAIQGVFVNLLNRYGIKDVRVEQAIQFHAVQAKMGNSTSNDAGCGIGTLGIVLIDANDVRGYLTNAHVAAANGRLLCVNGTEKDQLWPARGDSHTCNTTRKIGELVAKTRIPVGKTTAAMVDGAFVKEISGEISPENACNLCPSDLSIVAPKDAKGMGVHACGRNNTTATKGTVIEDEVTAWVSYPCGGRALFTRQILVEHKKDDPVFAPPGYSGAVAYGTDAGGNVAGIVGLIFAADLSERRTLMNPMKTVLDELTALNNGVKITIDEDRHCK